MKREEAKTAAEEWVDKLSISYGVVIQEHDLHFCVVSPQHGHLAIFEFDRPRELPAIGTPVRCRNKGILGYSMGRENDSGQLLIASDSAGKDIMWSTRNWEMLDLDAAARLPEAMALLQRVNLAVNTKPIPEDKTLRFDIRNFLKDEES